MAREEETTIFTASETVSSNKGHESFTLHGCIPKRLLMGSLYAHVNPTSKIHWSCFQSVSAWRTGQRSLERVSWRIQLFHTYLQHPLGNKTNNLCTCNSYIPTFICEFGGCKVKYSYKRVRGVCTIVRSLPTHIESVDQCVATHLTHRRDMGKWVNVLEHFLYTERVLYDTNAMCENNVSCMPYVLLDISMWYRSP